MTATIKVGIIVAASALFGVGLTLFFEWLRRKSEERRWHADYFLGRKIDALSNLLVTLTDCHFTMNFYGNYPPDTLEEYKNKIQSKETDFFRAKALSYIYLDTEGDKIMSEVLGAFRQAGILIHRNIGTSDSAKIEWDGFVKKYENAITWLKKKLNPEVLKDVEEFLKA